MSYCDFNPRLFNKFTSAKKKVQPTLASDWEIVPESYNRIGGFGLRSVTTEQYIQDIDLRRFLRFCGEQNITINGLHLIGEFVVGSDRSVYTPEMFYQWKEKFDGRVSGACLSYNELEPGQVYKTVCGAEIIFLDVMNIKLFKDEHDPLDGTAKKCTKRVLYLDVNSYATGKTCGYNVKSRKASDMKNLSLVASSDYQLDAEKARFNVDLYLNTSNNVAWWSHTGDTKETELVGIPVPPEISSNICNVWTLVKTKKGEQYYVDLQKENYYRPDNKELLIGSIIDQRDCYSGEILTTNFQRLTHNQSIDVFGGSGFAYGYNPRNLNKLEILGFYKIRIKDGTEN